MNGSFQEQGAKLIRESCVILERDVEAALKDRDYNMVVRRSQEVVELALKGVLKMLGVDYPKVHDVGPLFSEQARTKCCIHDEKSLHEIERISLWLSQARAPSFYGEREYGAQDADEAVNDARFIVDQVRKMVNVADNT